MASETKEVKMSIEDKRSYIISTATQLSRDARSDIAQWVNINAPQHAWDKPDGAYVDLQKMTDSKIESLYSIVYHRVHGSSSA
jgi:hypothetical protein